MELLVRKVFANTKLILLKINESFLDMEKNLVALAEEYCKHYHKGQFRKGGNQEPYWVHPFAVRDILVKSGFATEEDQIVALLHDTLEDTDLMKRKKDIEKVFGSVAYDGVYVLSKNTLGSDYEGFGPLFLAQGIDLTNGNGKLTDQAYKLRLLFSRRAFQRIKIADMENNTENFQELSEKGIRKKLVDALIFYIPLGQVIAPVMVKGLERNVENYMQSTHYRETFPDGIGLDN